MANQQPEWAAAKVRQTFLDYFKQRGHTFGRRPWTALSMERVN